MGKKLVKSESDIRKSMLMPNKNDILGVVEKNFGFTRMKVKCQDGHQRMCRIRGKMKKRSWVREGDVVLISPWDFEYESKGVLSLETPSTGAIMFTAGGMVSGPRTS